MVNESCVASSIDADAWCERAIEMVTFELKDSGHPMHTKPPNHLFELTNVSHLSKIWNTNQSFGKNWTQTRGIQVWCSTRQAKELAVPTMPQTFPSFEPVSLRKAELRENSGLWLFGSDFQIWARQIFKFKNASSWLFVFVYQKGHFLMFSLLLTGNETGQRSKK